MNRRGRNPNANPGVKPVTRIELDERKNKKRTILAVALLVVGMGFLGYALFSALAKDPGWVQIEPVTSSADSVAGDMVFLYELGASGQSPTAEHKVLARRYTELCIEAYRIFSANTAFDGVHNLYEVNLHAGDVVAVSPALYRAFEQIERADSRILFAAPFSREYTNLFLSGEDGFAVEYDPRKSEEVASYFAELSAFTASREHIRLDLLGDNKVQLVISDAYRAFARENGIEIFVDFFWTRNAFAVDYIVEALIADGYTCGTLSSYDGYARSLDTREVEFAYHLYAIEDNSLYDAVSLNYTGRQSMVYFRTYPLYAMDDRYYTYQSGERRHPYIDVTDGLCKNTVDGLIAYAADKSCAEVLLSAMPVFIADTWQEDALSDMKNNGIFVLYPDGTTIHCNDPAAKLTNVYQGQTATFTIQIDN